MDERVREPPDVVIKGELRDRELDGSEVPLNTRLDRVSVQLLL